MRENMHVLLVYPEFPQTFWSFDRALELVGRKVLMPPLGLITVAALLPAHWKLRLVDENIRPVSKADWHWADLVIISAMLVQKKGLARLIARARQSRLPVAVGGPFATSTPEAPELALANFLILDEGEITIPRWIEAIENGAKNGRFSAEGEKPDISFSPIPRFDLLERRAYDMMAVQFSRGCPFQCEFCDIIVLYGRKPRTKSTDQLLAELDALRALHWRGSIFLVDDNFIGNKRNVQLLLPKLKEWQRQHGFPFLFTTEASVDLASDPDLIAQMVDCGFQRVFLGIETPDTDSLRGAGKLQNTRSPLEEAVETITSRGLQVMAGFILGFDGEQPEAGRRIVEFVTRTGIPLAMVGVLQALPNTALWHRLRNENRLLEGDGRFDEGVQTHLFNFLPSRPIDQIGAEFVEAFHQLYEPRAYLERAYRTCRSLAAADQRRGNERGRGRLQLPDPGLLRGLLILLWRQGIRRESRWLFWRQLGAMAWRHPSRLVDYFWLLMLEEHFLSYRDVVAQQVEAQLASRSRRQPQQASLSGAPLKRKALALPPWQPAPRKRSNRIEGAPTSPSPRKT